MKKVLPRLVLAALLASPSFGAAAGGTAPSGQPAALPHVRQTPKAKAADPAPSDKPAPPTADAATRDELAKIGWKAVEDGALVRVAGADKGYVPGNYLTAAGIEWKDGRLAFAGGDRIDPKLLPMILEGLWTFVSAAQPSAADVGKQLAAWGLPPVIDGRKLTNPDGTATYYGQMLRLIYSGKPEALKLAGVERLSQALDLLTHAQDQAFNHQSPDVAKTDVDRARLMLFAPPRAGETPFAVKPYPDVAAQLDGFIKELTADRDAAVAAGDAVRGKDSAAALLVLGALQGQRYHSSVDLPDVPVPGRAAAGSDDDGDDAQSAPAHASLASGLPLVLKALDRVNGKPLTPSQQENLIKSFPMGDLVWRLDAQKLWSQGLTGKGVKVAVIDAGIGRHDELAEAVKSRTNLTADRGKALSDDHGTHVAGIIHALAPDAQINGYTVFAADGANPALKESADPLVIAAIEKAVKDGNRIINLSLAGAGTPSDVVSREIEKYSGKGVIFVVAAGNERDANQVEAPANAPNAFAVGALDGAGRAADFSSYGADFDPRKLRYVVKKIFMTPGTNIYSTVMDGASSSYQLMDGTSMATPAMSGVIALLAQSAGTLDPVAFSAKLSDALAESSTPLSLDKLPPNAPIDQPFLVVKPLAALDALRAAAAPLTTGGPKQKAGAN